MRASTLLSGAGRAACYAHALEMFPGVKNLLLHNWAVFQQHHDSVWGLSTAMNSMLDTFEKDCKKRNVPKVWRWFWDGDIPNEEFARAMRLQAMDRPLVQFWVYTRNFEVAPTAAPQGQPDGVPQR